MLDIANRTSKDERQINISSYICKEKKFDVLNGTFCARQTLNER